MATTTVAAGKIRNKANENLPAPAGWLVTKDGQPSTDPREVSKGGFMTSLGGTPEGSSHKGYGLGAMVNILSSALSGAAMVTDPMHTKKPGTMDIGHFFLAMDPGMFRDTADFRADVATFCDTLRATEPADPAKPVLVAGDPERRTPRRHEDRHSRRSQSAGQGPRGRARIRRRLDHGRLAFRYFGRNRTDGQSPRLRFSPVMAGEAQMNDVVWKSFKVASRTSAGNPRATTCNGKTARSTAAGAECCASTRTGSP